MSSLKKNSKSKNDNVKMSFVERTIYRKLYDTLEKSLKACYQVYKEFLLESEIDEEYILTFEEFCKIVDKKLKGEK